MISKNIKINDTEFFIWDADDYAHGNLYPYKSKVVSITYKKLKDGNNLNIPLDDFLAFAAIYKDKK